MWRDNYICFHNNGTVVFEKRIERAIPCPERNARNWLSCRCYKLLARPLTLKSGNGLGDFSWAKNLLIWCCFRHREFSDIQTMPWKWTFWPKWLCASGPVSVFGPVQYNECKLIIYRRPQICFARVCTFLNFVCRAIAVVWNVWPFGLVESSFIQKVFFFPVKLVKLPVALFISSALDCAGNRTVCI